MTTLVPEGAAGPPTTDVLASAQEPSRPRRRSAAVAAVLAGVLVVAVAVGAVALVRRIGLGLGDRPEAVVPASALAMVRLDLDPALGQKVEALRFFRHFTSEVPADDVDLRRWFVEQVDDEDLPWSAVEPWLGQRVAVVVLPGAQEPAVAGVLAVTDEKRARASLQRITEAEGGVFRVQDGWAYVAADVPALDAATAGGEPLADAQAFQDTLDAVGADAPLVAYADLDRFGELLRSVGATTGADRVLGGEVPDTQAEIDALADSLGGRVGVGVRFTADQMELTTVARGVPDWPVASTEGAETIASAPAGSLAAGHLVGGADLLERQWPRLLDQLAGSSGVDVEQEVATVERELGVTLPDDLALLFGSSLVAAVDADGLTTGAPKVGAVVRTDAARADVLIDRLLAGAEEEGAEVPAAGFVHRADGDRLLLGTDEAYVSRFGGAGGTETLGSDERVRAAVADLDAAQTALWVDGDQLWEALALQGVPDVPPWLERLDGVGLSSVTTGEGEATVTLRVTAD